MGLCCQRFSKEKEAEPNKLCGPKGSNTSRPDSESSAQYSPGIPLSEGCNASDESNEFEVSLSPNFPKETVSNTHLQVIPFFGPRKGSKTPSSGRSSIASILSVQSAVQLTRMSSLRNDDGEIIDDEIRRQRSRRTVSLRLPSKHRRSYDSETKVPTIYVDDPPSRPVRRKSSLYRALSVLTVSSEPSKPRPVQKILRQPTRRRHVRGISGLAVAEPNISGINRTQTLYYPTNRPSPSRRTAAAYS